MTETVRWSATPNSVIENGYAACPVLAPEATVESGLRAMLAAAMRSLGDACRKGTPDRPESIHRFRIGLRRMRSVLSAFSGVLPRDERRALSARLGTAAKAYSRAREWDVFLSGTVQPLAESLPDEPALLELDAMAREARRQALPGPGLGSQIDAVIAAVEEADWLRDRNGEFELEWQKDLKSFVADLLAKHHRRLRNRLKTIDIADRTALHHLRVQAKKIRYPIEMFENLFDAKRVDGYLDRLIAVQDALGLLNDAFVGRELLDELALSSRPQGLVRGWLAREIAMRRQRLPRAAKRLRKAAPFWEE